MSDTEYYIAVTKRTLQDGRTLYGVTVGQNLRKNAVDPGDGVGSVYSPADTHKEVIENARDALDTYQDPENRQDGRPVPTPQTTELRDETDEFDMTDFFDSTVQGFMQAGEA